MLGMVPRDMVLAVQVNKGQGKDYGTLSWRGGDIPRLSILSPHLGLFLIKSKQKEA